MKFLAQCTFRETVLLNGLMVDAVDFTVEAPSASIAEQKIMNCYPDVASCNIELIENEGNKLKYFVVINACVCVAAYFLLKPYQNNLTNWSGILGTLVNTAGLVLWGFHCWCVYLLHQCLWDFRIKFQKVG